MMACIVRITDGRSVLWQYDTGVQIQLLGCAHATECHFVVPGGVIRREVADGLCDVPDGALTQAGILTIYAYERRSDGGVTRHEIRLIVNARPKPADYVDPPDEADNLEALAQRVAQIIGPGEGGGGSLPGKDGKDGGYYTPTVTQPDESTMHIEYAASSEDMPGIAPVDVTLPRGEKGDKGDPGTNATVTKDSVTSALGYTPADQRKVAELSEEIGDLKENGVGVTADATLSESGKAADAKVTGELFGVAPGVSKNLNITAYVNKTTKGVTFTRNEDNSVTVTGTATEECWALTPTEGRKQLFYLLPGTYVFTDGYDDKAGGVRGYVCLYDSPEDTTVKKQVSATSDDPITFTIDKPMYGYVQIAVRPSAGTVNATLKLQLEKGKYATEYVSPFTDTVRSKRLDDLEESAKELKQSVSPFSVPSYYFADNYLYDRIAAVKAKMQECVGRGDAFIFITDTHWTQNAGNSPALINYIADKVNITKLINGGDTGNAGGAVDFADEIRKAFPGRSYHVFGNHEYFYPATGSLLAYNMSMYYEDVHTDDPDRNYYYFDNNRAHIRYIVLDSYAPGTVDSTGAKPGYEEAQISWLTNTALDVPDGWGIVVFTHHMYYMNLTTMALTAPPAGGQAALDALDAYNANEGSKGEVICVVQGHTHHDRITHTSGGIPVVITACDKYQPWMDGDKNKEPWLATRVAGTITEQAFDIVVMDREARELHFFRIGGDAFNGVDDDPGEPVNLRTVTY